jgi:hypothetical protein
MARRKKKQKTRVLPQAQRQPQLADRNTDVEKLKELLERLPAGKVAVMSGENARYTLFHASLASLIIPQDSRFDFLQGCYVVDSSNQAIARMFPQEDWIMFMGDDHVFPPWFVLNLLTKMYHYDFDILAPLCFRRSFPPSPVVFKLQERDEETGRETLVPITLDDHPEGGIIQVDAVGSAGMIVRRRVLEGMKPPWFRLGGEMQEGEDIYFCRSVREAGFKIHVDLGVGLGHIINATLWPKRTDQGWGVQYDFGGRGGFFMPLENLEDAIVPEQPVAVDANTPEDVLKGLRAR